MNHDAIFQQNEARIAADDSFQRGAVGLAERIFSSRHIAPQADGLIAAGCESIERIVVVLCILIDLIDEVQLRVVCLLQIGRHKQKGVALAVQHLLGDILTVVHPFDEEVGIG